MQSVVADTGPLNYLILIEAVGVLPRLFSPVLISAGVREELSHPKAPIVVRTWIAHPPSWLNMATIKALPYTEPSALDSGERQAIAPAMERKAALLMDEREGVSEARRIGLEVIGTLAVLVRAAARGWIDLPEMFRRLRTTSFRSPVHLMARFLEEDARRRK